MFQHNLSKTFQSIIKASPAPPAEIVQHLLGLCGKRKWQLSNSLNLSPQTASIVFNTLDPTPSQAKHRLETARFLSQWLSETMGEPIEIRPEDIWTRAETGRTEEQAAA